MLMRLKLCLPLISCLLVLSSCGGDSSQGEAGATSAKQTAATTLDRACHRQTGRFVAALDSLRGQLIAGLSYRQYARALGVVRAAYGELPVAKLRPECLSGTAFAEDALNQYIVAANLWSKCLADSGCDQGANRPVVAGKWWAAGVVLSKAHRELTESPVNTKGLPPPLPLP